MTDGGTPHVVAEWGGTMFNWMRNRTGYITPERPDKFWFETYSRSAERFRGIAAQAGADVLISNHTNFDGSKTELPALAARKPRRSASVCDRERRREALPGDGGRVCAGRVWSA